MSERHRWRNLHSSLFQVRVCITQGETTRRFLSSLTFIQSLSFLFFLTESEVRGHQQRSEVRVHQGPSGTAHFLFRTWTTSLLSVRKFPKASASLLSSVAENKKGTKDFSLIIYMILFCIFVLFCFFTVFSHRCDRCRPCRCPPPPPPRQGYHGSWWGHWARRCQLPLWTGSIQNSNTTINYSTTISLQSTIKFFF